MKNKEEMQAPDKSAGIFAGTFNEPTQRDKKIIFWILSLIIVPTFAYIYSAALTLVATPVFNLIVKNQTEDRIGMLVFFIIVLSLAFAIASYLQLWKMYKKHFMKV